MLRRSTRTNQNPNYRQTKIPAKGQSSTDSYSYEHEGLKLKKSFPNQKFNRNLKNPYSSIEQCPSIELTTEQMQGNFLQFLSQLQTEFSSYGAIKLIASQDWAPSFTFKYVHQPITTRNQILQELTLGKVKMLQFYFLMKQLFLFQSFIQPFDQNVNIYCANDYKQLALEFQQKYKHVTKTDGTSFEQNQFQFWSLVSNPKYSELQVEVQYAADIPTGKYCSGFPTTKQKRSSDHNFNYCQSLYNLNNTFKDPLSLLKVCEGTKSKISGITQPWLYMGMKFASFCWHTEDLYMNSINYNHKGSTKTWYIIPESDKQKMDSYIQQKYGHITKGNPAFIHQRTLMINPLELIKQGIKVFKINQSPKCYVVTFPKAYHCGFSQGFNIGEAANYSTVQTIPYLIQAENEYKEYNNKKKQVLSVLPVEWLIDQNYQMLEVEKSTAEWKQTITKYFKQCISKQLGLIKSLVKQKKIIGFSVLQKNKMKYFKNPCALCTQYLYFSMIKCIKCLKIYCLDHDLCCCKNEFEIVVRQIQKERKPLLKVLESIGK